MTPTVAACVALLKVEEGCRLHPYQDVAGNWTIGYGNRTINGALVTGHTPPIAQATADALLAGTVEPLIEKVQGWVGHNLTDAQWASLVSFAYNLGPMTLYHSSLLTVVRAGYLDMASRMFAPYCHAGGVMVPGLAARRAKEAVAFASHGASLAAPTTTDALNAASLAAHAGQ